MFVSETRIIYNIPILFRMLKSCDFLINISDMVAKETALADFN
jgi:hypothetical protein